MSTAAKKSAVRKHAAKGRGAGRKGKKGAKKKKKSSLSRLKKPDNMSLRDWQTELRRQYGAEQKYRLRNLGDEPIFGEFEVENPESKRSYRVSIRGTDVGVNYCTCPDFRTNTLGTCKHIEFVIERLRRKRGGKSALRNGYQSSFSEIRLNYGWKREVRFFPGEDCPAEMARLAGRYFDDEGKLLAESYAKFDQFLRKTHEIDHEVRVGDDVLEYVAQMRDSQSRKEVLKNSFSRGARSAAFRKLIKTDLYSYQREGALFAAQAGRCLIGDDMGLGKTIQAIAAAEIMSQNFGVERVLVVCPTSLKHQWEREIRKFTEKSVEVVGGMFASRQAHFLKEGPFYKITNYDTVHRDIEFINRWSPDLVILDEAQRIKNWNTRAARSVKQIVSPYCVVLTGTPLENRLEELVSIVQFIDQHRLGPTFEFLDKHQDKDEKTGQVIGYRDLNEVAKTLSPILIRRRKDEVLQDLPPRLEKFFFTPMTPQQQHHHAENRELVARIVYKWRRYGFLSEADQRRLMIGLQNMRMSCDSTFLLDKRTDHSTKPDELATLLEEVFEDPRAKVVIFSQWLRMHEVIRRRLDDRGWKYVMFHGGVPSAKRKNLVDQFREDPECRLFLATDAGGVGLNLQNASVVANLDIPWNPAVLEQRIGRVYRLGQTQPVRVVNFVAEGTIEQGMLKLLDFKKSLAEGILDGGEKHVFLGKSRLSKFMETVEKATSDIPDRPSPPAAEPPERDIEVDTVIDEVDEADEDTIIEPPAAGSQTAVPATAPSAAASQPSAAMAGADPLSGILAGGLAFLQQLADASQAAGKPASSDSDDSSAEPAPQKFGPLELRRDEESNEPYLRMSAPKPEAVGQLVHALSNFLESMRS